MHDDAANRPSCINSTESNPIRDFSKGLADPRIQGLVTITRVEVSGDLANATLYCTVTPHKQEDLAMHGLQSAANWIRSAKLQTRCDFEECHTLHLKSMNNLIRQQEVLASIAEATT